MEQNKFAWERDKNTTSRHTNKKIYKGNHDSSQTILKSTFQGVLKVKEKNENESQSNDGQLKTTYVYRDKVIKFDIMYLLID